MKPWVIALFLATGIAAVVLLKRKPQSAGSTASYGSTFSKPQSGAKAAAGGASAVKSNSDSSLTGILAGILGLKSKSNGGGSGVQIGASAGKGKTGGVEDVRPSSTRDGYIPKTQQDAILREMGIGTSEIEPGLTYHPEADAVGSDIGFSGYQDASGTYSPEPESVGVDNSNDYIPPEIDNGDYGD